MYTIGQALHVQRSLSCIQAIVMEQKSGDLRSNLGGVKDPRRAGKEGFHRFAGAKSK